MTREEAQKIIDIIVEKEDKEDYELIINREKDDYLCDYNTLFTYAYTIKNDEGNIWEHDFQTICGTDYSDEEIIDILMECDKYIISDATKTIFVWKAN